MRSSLSMMRAVIRHAVHVQMLWKEWEPHPGKRLVIFVLGSNVLLILWHLLSHLPTPLDYQNGYLHGGILIDFIGQSKARFLYSYADDQNLGASRVSFF